MRKVFLLVMVCLLLVLTVSCKSKNERILEQVKKNVPSELVYRRELTTVYCKDIISLIKDNKESTEKCMGIMSDSEEEYNEKFLSLLELHNGDKMSREEVQELYNEIEKQKLKEESLKITDLISDMNISYFSNTIVLYKKISINSLFMIELSEEAGIYSTEIEKIKKNNDIEWQKDTAEELQIRSTLIIEKTKIPEFSDSKIQEYAERYLEFIETCKVYVMYSEKEKLLDYNSKNSEKIYSDAKNLLLNVSDEDGEKLLNYMKENNREYDEIIKKFTTKK